MLNFNDSTSTLGASASTASMDILPEEAIFDSSLVDTDRKVHYHNVRDLDHAYEISGTFLFAFPSTTQ
jgi:hypothetical protein